MEETTASGETTPAPSRWPLVLAALGVLVVAGLLGALFATVGDDQPQLATQGLSDRSATPTPIPTPRPAPTPTTERIVTPPPPDVLPTPTPRPPLREPASPPLPRPTATLPTPTPVPVEPSPIPELEAAWAERREIAIDRIYAEGWGIDGNVLNGPGGLTIDLDGCPTLWDNTEGIVDGVIKIGHTTALSGSLAAYGNIGTGLETYFDYVNRTGGIGPDRLQLELLVRDDSYIATQTQDAVDELLVRERPFAITTLGSPNTFAVRGMLRDACVPQPFVMTAHPAWGDPENFPWTIGLQSSYATEAALWRAWIDENMANQAPVTVSALVMDNEFGLAYEQAFERAAAQSSVIDAVTFVRHDPAGSVLTNEITTLAAADPDVYISMTAGNPCLVAMQEVARVGLPEGTVKIQPSVCAAVSPYLAPTGDDGDGWLVFAGGFKDPTDDRWSADPYVAWMNDELLAAGLDPAVSLYSTGFGQFGWAHVEALRIAAELEGGLTRTNLLLAMWSLELDHPMLHDGIAFSTNGFNDPYPTEGSTVDRFDAATQSWITVGSAIELDGITLPCMWIAGAGGGCR